MTQLMLLFKVSPLSLAMWNYSNFWQFLNILDKNWDWKMQNIFQKFTLRCEYFEDFHLLVPLATRQEKLHDLWFSKSFKWSGPSARICINFPNKQIIVNHNDTRVCNKPSYLDKGGNFEKSNKLEFTFLATMFWLSTGASCLCRFVKNWKWGMQCSYQ